MTTEACWPTDYVPRDAGRLMLHPRYVSVFDQLGWTTARDVLDRADSEVFRRIEQRENGRLTIPTPTGPELGYLKRHWSTATTAWRSAPGFWEADAVGWCQQADVPTVTIIAVGADPTGPGMVDSFFLSQGLVDAEPSQVLWDRLDDDERRRDLVDALATTVGRLHAADLFHRDLYWCHLYVSEQADGRYLARLIDLQRIIRQPTLRWRWLLKDLAQLEFSTPIDAREPVLQSDFQRRYLQCVGPQKAPPPSWLIHWRAKLYHLHESRRTDHAVTLNQRQAA